MHRFSVSTLMHCIRSQMRQQYMNIEMIESENSSEEMAEYNRNAKVCMYHSDRQFASRNNYCSEIFHFD